MTQHSRSLRHRRGLRTLLAALGAALAITMTLAGCSAGSNSSATNSTSTTNSTSGAGSTSYPVSITTAFGTTTIKSAPKRVVALGWGDAETALELGVQPVGASDWLGFGGDGVGPWLKGAYKKSPTIIGTLEPNYEQIVKLHPDLILDVKSSGDQNRYDKLSAIAPTVAIPKGGANYLTTTDQQVTMIAKALGKASEGKQLLASVDSAYAAARKAHPEFKGKTAVIGAYSSSGYGAYAGGDSRVQFMKNLGFKQPAAIDKAAGKNFSVSLSNENLDLLNADLTVILPIFTTAKQASSSALFQKVPSVANGHAIVESNKDVANAFSIGTPAAIKWALGRLPDEFAKKLG